MASGSPCEGMTTAGPASHLTEARVHVVSAGPVELDVAALA